MMDEKLLKELKPLNKEEREEVLNAQKSDIGETNLEEVNAGLL